MSTNSHHVSFKGIKKDFNYGSSRREFTPENALEQQNTNFSSLARDSFEKNPSSNEPLQVKDLQQKMHRQYKEETAIPPQPIINDKTLLALDYLQKYLLPNRTLQSINLPSTDPHDHDQESLYLKGSENVVSKSLNGDFGYQNPKIIELETNPRPKDSSYLTENEKYERSRSRSNEKKGSYDRIQRKDDERYRMDRSPYSKSYKNNLEENISEQSKKEDWECGNYGNVNWVKQRNCKKCGQKQSSFPDGKEFHSYHKGDSLVKRNDYRNFNKNISGK